VVLEKLTWNEDEKHEGDYSAYWAQNPMTFLNLDKKTAIATYFLCEHFNQN